MGGIQLQTVSERNALRAAWESDPLVKQALADCVEFAAERGLQFDAEGLTTCLAFLQKRIAAVDWPETGIIVG